MITDKLTREQQESIIKPLFGLEFINVDKESEKGHWVLYDDDGNEFYGSDANIHFDFSTLEGIFSYAANRAKNQGYSDCQYYIKKALGF